MISINLRDNNFVGLIDNSYTSDVARCELSDHMNFRVFGSISVVS